MFTLPFYLSVIYITLVSIWFCDCPLTPGHPGLLCFALQCAAQGLAQKSPNINVLCIEEKKSRVSAQEGKPAESSSILMFPARPHPLLPPPNTLTDGEQCAWRLVKAEPEEPGMLPPAVCKDQQIRCL